MIITRTPFRISFAGGGTDILSYYQYRTGHVLSVSIQKYMYITLCPSFLGKNIILKGSTIEKVSREDELRNPIARQIIHNYNIKGVEISSLADIPAGTGLGSSSAFCVGLIHAVRKYKKMKNLNMELASEACNVEIRDLGEPIGKQDQYGCAIGGLKLIHFLKDENVLVEEVKISSKCIFLLENNLLVFYVGGTHDAREILRRQINDIEKFNRMKYLERMGELACEMKKNIEKQDLSQFGKLLDEEWQLKKKLSNEITNENIDYWYETAKRNGAIGGKLLGAGGAGFLLIYCESDKQEKLRSAMKNLIEIPFKIDNTGSVVIYAD